jgi:TonB family protein
MCTGGVSTACSRISLAILITLLTATAAVSQDEQKEPAPPHNAANGSSQSNASVPTSSTIHAGANVTSAMLVHQVAPAYPPLAKTAHISGTVMLHALIAKDGTIEQLQVVSGPPLLLKSAMDAVQQWEYRPTLVNGDPVRVDTTISVVYTLGEKNPNNAGGSGSPSAAPGSSTDLPPTPTVDLSQDPQKDAAASQTPANASSEPNSSTPKPKSIRVGGSVASANLIHQVRPIYPKDAKKQHITGTVMLHVIIAQNGSVKTVEYVNGPPELTSSAMEAVKQWRYKPTLIKGEPLQVDTTISVVFTLGNH